MKIIIELEDRFDGGVKVSCKPTLEEIAKTKLSGHDYTSAQAYAMFCLLRLREASLEQNKSKVKVEIPKLIQP